MIEELLRESFARHEPQAPAVTDLRTGIERLVTRRRRARRALLFGSVAAAVAAVLVAAPLVLRTAQPALRDAIPDTLAGSLPPGPLDILLLGLERRPLVPSLFATAVVTGLVYGVFVAWLGIALPVGPLGI